ncbi:MAG: UDP-N-acetylglucosamine--N-acetylmuramyl-(pentapeptide) pyrophosphoryl-undecaprenol N-acetylglucosamine transferase [Patescibacteria group bacterium]
MKKNRKKIILSGGGTAGPVVPLLFINKKLKDDYDLLFVGTYNGIERKIIEDENIKYRAICSGKFRRYFSLDNFIDIFKIFAGFWQSLFLIIKERPSIVISAGGFVAVPLSLAAYILRVPVLIHQQDVLPGLANKLIAPFAKTITVTFKSSIDYYGKKAVLIGNTGIEIDNYEDEGLYVFDKYKLNKEKKLLVVLGGGTGSFFINNLIFNSLDQLLKEFNIIHITGSENRVDDVGPERDNYYSSSFMKHDELINVFKASDLVVSRCGLSTLTEISFLKKASILIPMPNSHQEYNAFEFKDREAAIVLNEKDLTVEIFIENVIRVSSDTDLRNRLIKNSAKVIKNGNQEMIAIIRNVLED